MPNKPIPIRNLHIFLAKEEYRGQDDLLENPGEYEYQSVRISAGFLGLLAMKPSRPRPPEWLGFFTGALQDPEELPLLVTSSASAVLLLECAGRTFLLTFGHGRSMIADGVVEPRFGLKATLNAIHPDKLRSLDRKTFERIQRLSREQLSRDSGFHAFGLNVEQDLLSAVVGAPEDEVYGHRLAGRDALTTFVSCNLDDLPTVLELYLELSQQDRYKQIFPWVDNIAEVGDRRTRDLLEQELCRKIRRQELDDIVLTPPDLIDWEEFGHFLFRNTPNAPRHVELDWNDYFHEVRPPNLFDPKHLRIDHIACAKGDGSGLLTTWSLHRCIAGEIQLGNERYVVNEGKWYCINHDFAARVVSAIRAIPCCAETLPRYVHRDEETYNKAVETAGLGRWALMDRKLIRTNTAHGAIEFCDLFSDQKHMIHAKRHAGSAPLSHLFAQGVVAARLFQGDASFRRLVNAKLPASHQLADPDAMIDSREYEVAYVILGSPGARRPIPFFSMVNLRGAHELLTSLNYRVTLTHV